MTPHSTVAAFATRSGCLCVGGVPVDLLAERVGGTPFFAYDRGLLTGRVAELRAALPPGIDLSYAVKANPMPAVVHHLSGLVDSFDVASALELRTALNTTMPPSRVSFAGPGKAPAELRQAVAAGVTVEMESATEARRLIEIGQRLGIRPRVAVRVNPDFEIKGSGMRMGGGPQQFGVDAEQVPALLKELAGAEVDVLGFHVFAGSQNLRADILAEAQRKTVDLLLRLAETAPVAGPVPQPRRRVRHPLLREGHAAGSGRDRSQPRRAARDEDPGTVPRGSRGHRAWPVHRRRVRRLRHADRSTARSRGGGPSWWSTVACTTSSPRPATSGR